MARATQRYLVILGALLYVSMLQAVYVAFIAPAFSYLGYQNHGPVEVAVLFGTTLAVLPSLSLPIALTRPSQVVHWLLYVLVLIPAMVIPLYASKPPLPPMLLFQTVLVASFILLVQTHRLPLLSLRHLNLSRTAFWGSVICVSVVFYAMVIQRFGLRLEMISFADVYDTRAQFRETLGEGGGLIGYVLTWQAKVINAFVLAFALLRRNWVLFSVGFAGQLMLYSVTGHKSIFLAFVVIAAVYFGLRNHKRHFGLLVQWGSLSLIVLSSLILVFSGSASMMSLLVRRVIVTPGLLTARYIEFFSEHPKALLGHSVFGRIVDYAYDQPPSKLIGQTFWTPETSANAHVWADAFANFGLVGVFVFTLLLGACLWIYDSMAKGLDLRLSAMLLAVPAISLSNTGLLTTVSTHGLALAILLVYLIPRDGHRPAWAPSPLRRPDTTAQQRDRAPGETLGIAGSSLQRERS